MELFPLVDSIDPERAHKASVRLLATPRFTRYLFGLIDTAPPADCLATDAFGLHFPSPVGLAAGFDKDGQVIDGCLDLGFGFVEIGSVTPEPQPGNPTPRLFRLTADRSVINRYGFNSAGSGYVANVLARRFDNRQAMLDHRHKEAREQSAPRKINRVFGGLFDGPPITPPKETSAAELGIVGVNLGKNKTSESAADDYEHGVRTLGPHAHYLVVNVSSPNTPGLRSLQSSDALPSLLTRVLAARDALPARSTPGFPTRPAVLVKVAPDLSAEERADVARACLSAGVDGLVVSNTTTARPDTLKDKVRAVEAGGLSGAALRDASTAMVADMYTLTKGKVPIIGVGGIASGQDAYDKVRAGASLVQLYSSMVFEGPRVVKQVKDGLAERVQADGFAHVSEAVGRDAAKMCSPELKR